MTQDPTMAQDRPLSVSDDVVLLDLVSDATLLRARSYLKAAAFQLYTGSQQRLIGTVTGHRATVEVLRDADGRLVDLIANCDCRSGRRCAHAVTLLLAANERHRATGTTGRPGEPAGQGASDGPGPSWHGVLAGLLVESSASARDQRRPPARPPSAVIGLQFELGGDPPKTLDVAPVQPGRTGQWVKQGLTWRSFDYPDYHLRSFPAEHITLLSELLGLGQRGVYAFTDRSLPLAGLASRRVWDLLLEAQQAGLPLIRAGRRGDPVRVHPTRAVARLDAVRVDGGDLELRPRLDLAGRAVDPAHSLLLGTPPHGVAWWSDPAAERRAARDHDPTLHLAALAGPPDPIYDRLLSGPSPRIPAADEQQFLDEFYPRLRERIELVSPDGAVPLPAPAPPRLGLTVERVGEHRITVGWQWIHRLGNREWREPLLAEQPGAEQPDAQRREVLARVLPVLREPAELLDPRSVPPMPVDGLSLDGLSTVRFLSDVLPLLREHPDVEVLSEPDGDLPRYREADQAPVISFVGQPGGNHDWFDLAVTVTVDGEQVPFDQLFVALAQQQDHLILPSGTWFGLDRPEFSRLAELIAESRALLDAPEGTVRLNRFQAGLWSDLQRLGEISGRVEEWQESVRALSEAGTPLVPPVPAGLTAELRPYQQAGFGWLATLYAHRLGGVLADDMGLGKTVQTLALILHTREQDPAGRPFLVVAPTSVVGTWAGEAARFAPSLKVATITETVARRGHDVAAAVAGADLVITSYTLFRLEFEDYHALAWAGLVLDEAQAVKNHQSTGYRCAAMLPVPFKLAITGTPMENHLMELWSLLSITAPGLFAHPTRFTEYYRTPIERGGDAARLALLRRRIKPLLLRRTKGQVAADLPDRQEQVIELELNPKHRTLYQRYLQRERQKVLGLLGDLQRNRFEIFRSLTLLRQASLDLSLIDPQHAGVPSTKLDALMEHLVEIIEEGHRVLVFSQFTRFLTLARNRLVDAGIEHCYLDGSTRNRPAVISEFRTGTAPVFLISLKAGGTGLTLTEADYVVLLDPWWNPATEAQAVDRVHRIGQTRKVMVYRLVARDTIEEKVMALKAAKSALFAGVLDGGDLASGALTAEDIRGLLD